MIKDKNSLQGYTCYSKRKNKYFCKDFYSIIGNFSKCAKLVWNITILTISRRVTKWCPY